MMSRTTSNGKFFAVPSSTDVNQTARQTVVKMVGVRSFRIAYKRYCVAAAWLNGSMRLRSPVRRFVCHHVLSS